jgi:hypothetical protein
MVSLLLRPALGFTALFALFVLLIRAQPYDDSDLRSLLTPPEDCLAPCFLGIRPGVTDAEDALILLESHPWVAHVEGAQAGTRRNALVAPGYTAPVVHWTWSDQRPAWLTLGRNGELWLADGKVRASGVAASFRLGDLRLTFGPPARSSLAAFTSANGDFWSYRGWYDGQGVWVAASGLCPLHRLPTGRVLFRFQAAPPNLSDVDTSGPVC